jgi:hypothetical protein
MHGRSWATTVEPIDGKWDDRGLKALHAYMVHSSRAACSAKGQVMLFVAETPLPKLAQPLTRMSSPSGARVVACFLIGMAGAPTWAHAQSADPLPTNCAGLRVMLSAKIDRMRKLQERAKQERKAPPADIVSAWQRTFGKEGDGIPSLKELKRVREQADRLNDALQARACPTIDIDQALRSHLQGAPAPS